MNLSMILSVIAATQVVSEPICNERERWILEEVAGQRYGLNLIYAIDETKSSRNSLEKIFQNLNYSVRDQKFPFLFSSNDFKELVATTIQALGFCPSSTSYELLSGYIRNNGTMIAVLFGCNMFTFRESIFVIKSEGNPMSKNSKNLKINRASESKFCKCREIQETFTRNCLSGHGYINYSLLFGLSCIAVGLFFFVALRAFIRNRE